jgi:hypothetical protein
MALAGYVVEVLFGALGLIPPSRAAIVAEPQITLNYTTILNVAFLALALVLVWRAARTGIGEMLKMMDEMPIAAQHRHAH